MLVHGWGFSPAIWNPVLAALDGVAVCALRLPGHGGYPGAERLADAASLAQALIEQVPDGSEPVWVGWSLGGLAALAAAAQWRGPQRLALVCANPRFTAAADWPCALVPATLAAFAEEMERDRAALERHFAALCALGARTPAALRRQLLAALAADPADPAGLRAGLAALTGFDLRPAWEDVDAPVSAWFAESDALVPVAAAPTLRRLRPDARVRTVPGGHASWLEEPVGLAGFLRELTE